MASLRFGCFPNYSLYAGVASPIISGYSFTSSFPGTATAPLRTQDIHDKWIDPYDDRGSCVSNLIITSLGDLFVSPSGRLLDAPFGVSALALINNNFAVGSQVMIRTGTSSASLPHTMENPKTSTALVFTNTSGNATGAVTDIDEDLGSPDNTYVHLETDDAVVVDMDFTGTPSANANDQLFVAMLDVTSINVTSIQVSFETDITSMTSLGTLRVAPGDDLVIRVPWTFPTGATRVAFKIAVVGTGEIDIDLVSWAKMTTYTSSYNSGWISANSFNYPSSHKFSAVGYNLVPQTFFHYFPDSESEDIIQIFIRNWSIGEDGGAYSHPSTTQIGHLAFGPYTDIFSIVDFEISVLDGTQTDESMGKNMFFDPRNTKRLFSAGIEASFETAIRDILNALFRLQGKSTPLLLSFLTEESDYTEALTAWVVPAKTENNMKWAKQWSDSNALSDMSMTIDFEEVV